MFLSFWSFCFSHLLDPLPGWLIANILQKKKSFKTPAIILGQFKNDDEYSFYISRPTGEIMY